MRPSVAARKRGLCCPQAPLGEDVAQIRRQLVRPDRFEAPARGPEYSGRAASERFGRRLGDRLERRGARERLPEHRGDPVEASLDPRLPFALREHLGIPDRQRRETRERLEDVRVPAHEATALAPADAEHAAHLVAPGHRRGDHVCEAAVRRVGNRLRDFAVRALDQRPRLPDGRTGEAVSQRKLETEQPSVEPVDRDAAEETTLAVEEVAVGGIGVEELCELVRQPLQHDRQVELAAEHVCRPEQGALLRELLLVPLQRLFERDAGAQPFERDGRLRGQRLHHRELLVREDPGLVEGRDRDHGRHAILHEQRDEGRALRADGVGEAWADDAGALRVVDRERGRLEDGTRDPGRLAR